MNFRKFNFLALLLCLVLFTHCKEDKEDQGYYKNNKPSSGHANFAIYVALGDSYTAGYTDGALGRRGQESSFPNIIAKQLAAVGNKGFRQPLVKSKGSVGIKETGYIELKMNGKTPSLLASAGDISIFSETVYKPKAPIHNLGLPDAKISHLLATVNNTAPSKTIQFMSRFVSGKSTNLITDALALNPTFISLWIGGNDILGYAIEGGENGEITTPETFDNYMSVIGEMLFSETPKKGVIANIPNLEDLPYFNYSASDSESLVIEDVQSEKKARTLLKVDKTVEVVPPISV